MNDINPSKYPFFIQLFLGDSRHPASNILSSVPPSMGANMGEKRPVQPNSRMQPPTKKPRLGVLKDVSLAEAGKFGTLNEYAFFDKVLLYLHLFINFNK